MMSPVHDIFDAIHHTLVESPIAERVMEKGTLGGTGVSVASAALTYAGLTEAEWTLVFAAGGLFFTVLFGSIHIWIKLQHLKIARGDKR